ncbi:MAG: tRNA (adenosine(37)-N6)-threonylcarbamoyltransferase complex dimerization subunit type 1 TsaB [Alphaproteobacteria bacterium]|nr:tRNA (adenosine(37)-N6)-threonylcarbamoyltransferase complex dimerization subunit type 1 TsaB [Alphaproteobacteria bacterium]
MLVLAIDTAGAACSAALRQGAENGGTVIAAKREDMPRGQDARLIPLVLELLREAGQPIGALDRIAATRGPGSFTGIRIGLAAACGLGAGANKPVFGVSRFALYRARAARPPGKPLLVVIDSKRDELFCRLFGADGVAAGEAFMATAENLRARFAGQPLALAGDNGALLQAIAAPAHTIAALPESEAACAAALAAGAGKPGDEWSPLPLYIRPPDVSCGPVWTGAAESTA